MTLKPSTDLIITPATWQQHVNKFDRTSTDLLNLVGWYGSTHTAAMWRKDPEFLRVFREHGVIGFDPQLDDWDPSFAAIEAEVLATAAVIIIRLENYELLNGSLGSIAEIGLALTSAALRGQVVIVSIEDNLLTTLNEPGAIAQYMMLELSIEHLDQVESLTRFLDIHRGNNLYELAHMACEAAQQQKIDCHECVNFGDFLAKKTRRSKNYPLRILLGGSGGAYSEVYDEQFTRKKDDLTSSYLKEEQVVKILSEGAIAEAWKIPYGSIDNIGVALATRTLLAIETEFKREADLLLLPIMAESASKAASSEIGFLLFHALVTGQNVRILLEPFDPVDYIRHQLKDVDYGATTDSKQARIALKEAGVADSILATAVREEVLEAFEIFKRLRQGDGPSFREIKRSLLGKTEAFHNADNIRRVRTLVQAHLEKLVSDERFSDFFDYSTQVINSD